MAEQFHLVRPTLAHEASFRAMIDDFRMAGEARYQNIPEMLKNDYPAWVRRMEEAASGLNLPPDRVPQSHYWLVDISSARPQILGTCKLRHRLNDYLLQIGGHIGYDVPPSQRQKGYGTLCLKLGLAQARALGLARVLVTCNTDNDASTRIIQKNGGQLDNEIFWLETGKFIARYWIDL